MIPLSKHLLSNCYLLDMHICVWTTILRLRALWKKQPQCLKKESNSETMNSPLGEVKRWTLPLSQMRIRNWPNNLLKAQLTFYKKTLFHYQALCVDYNARIPTHLSALIIREYNSEFPSDSQLVKCITDIKCPLCILI